VRAARLVGVALAFWAMLPRLAAACPACAGRSDGGSAKVVALGAMILLPFALAAVVVPVIRRGPAAEPRP
jgi:hypothetical protein